MSQCPICGEEEEYDGWKDACNNCGHYDEYKARLRRQRRRPRLRSDRL